MSAAGNCVGHGLADRIADGSLQVALGRRRQVVAAGRGRGFGGEDARGATLVSVSFDQHVGSDRLFVPRSKRDERVAR